jgi:hypothetical protein
MGEHQLQEKRFELLYEELKRVADELEAVRRRLAVLEALPPAVAELSRLASSIEALAYAALGRDGPRIRRRA